MKEGQCLLEGTKYKNREKDKSRKTKIIIQKNRVERNWDTHQLMTRERKPKPHQGYKKKNRPRQKKNCGTVHLK